MKKIVPFAVIIVCACLLALVFSSMANDKRTNTTVLYLDANVSGAAAYNHSGDHPESSYFVHPDFYNMTSNENLTIISHYKTYQQTTEYTCGASAALTVLAHFNNSEWDEMALAREMKASPHVGISVRNMTFFFKNIGWDVHSSVDEGVLEDGATFHDPADFTRWIINNLNYNLPIMVDWLDWGGHWQVIIGYDTMGTESFSDDVLILADPYDTSDHLQDGYYIFPAERFYYMWEDGYPEDPKKTHQPWLTAEPRDIVKNLLDEECDL